MKSKSKNTGNVSRKQFLRAVCSVVAGGSIAGVSATLLHRNIARRGGSVSSEPGALRTENNRLASPYQLVSSFDIPEGIAGFELMDGQLLVAAGNHIYSYHPSGKLSNSFAVEGTVRDIAVEDGLIYLLFPTRIEAYHISGKRMRGWDACSEQSDYCSFAIAEGSIFVSDAAAKNLCKYTSEGRFVKFIDSPNGFVIPSYSFGVTCVDGVIHCANSGRHQIEKYTFDGQYIGAFGLPGAVAGRFCGCCNPVHLTHTSAGEIITSEKGTPRISCYSGDGRFRTVLLDTRTLGGGNKAYEVNLKGDRIWVAGQKTISTFRYSKALAEATGCSGCEADCPLKEGLSI
jgi:hypothetical protein